MVEANNTNQPLIELRDINKFYPVGKETTCFKRIELDHPSRRVHFNHGEVR